MVYEFEPPGLMPLRRSELGFNERSERAVSERGKQRLSTIAHINLKIEIVCYHQHKSVAAILAQIKGANALLPNLNCCPLNTAALATFRLVAQQSEAGSIEAQ